jgi:Ca2+-binding RTX toxin-like protein
MPIQFLNGNTYGPYSGDVPDTLTVDAGATVHATTAGTAALTLGSGPWMDVCLNGKVTADNGAAVNLKSAGAFHSTVVVGPDAEVSGGGSSGAGIATAHATTIANSGSIKGGSSGILESGDGDFYIFNSGTIEGGSHGIGIWGLGTHQVITSGTITGGTYAIFGSSGAEWVANIGTLQGNVHLGDGNDILANFIKEEGQRYDGKVTGVIDLGGGDDQFFGGKFNETVKGGAGKDTLMGGRGTDKLFGGTEADTFAFTSVKDSLVGSKHDVIADFERGVDHIDLAGIDANAKKGGDQKFKFIGTKAFSKKAGELHYVKKGGYALVQGDVNGDGKADFEIKLDGITKLAADDFVL